jgi:hypothetical protein
MLVWDFGIISSPSRHQFIASVGRTQAQQLPMWYFGPLLLDGDAMSRWLSKHHIICHIPCTLAKFAAAIHVVLRDTYPTSHFKVFLMNHALEFIQGVSSLHCWGRFVSVHMTYALWVPPISWWVRQWPHATLPCWKAELKWWWLVCPGDQGMT